MSGKHQPCEYNKYFELHGFHMERLFLDGFVVEDRLEIFGVGSDTLNIKGTIVCQGGLDIDVEKYLAVTKHDGVYWLQTSKYKYAAHVAGLRGIFRYCSPHKHRRYHHRHPFDVFGSGIEDKTNIQEIEGDWPTLAEVIEELRDWYKSHAIELDELKRHLRRSRRRK